MFRGQRQRVSSIAFDENFPLAMVRVFQTFAGERQLKKLIGSVEVNGDFRCWHSTARCVCSPDGLVTDAY
jgi:hypothetical protein